MAWKNSTVVHVTGTDEDTIETLRIKARRARISAKATKFRADWLAQQDETHLGVAASRNSDVAALLRLAEEKKQEAEVYSEGARRRTLG